MTVLNIGVSSISRSRLVNKSSSPSTSLSSLSFYQSLQSSAAVTSVTTSSSAVLPALRSAALNAGFQWSSAEKDQRLSQAGDVALTSSCCDVGLTSLAGQVPVQLPASTGGFTATQPLITRLDRFGYTMVQSVFSNVIINVCPVDLYFTICRNLTTASMNC